MRFALFALFAKPALLAGVVKTATGKACNECKTRPVASLERKGFSERGSDFLNYVQHIFPGAKIFSVPPWLWPVQNTWSVGIGLCLNAFLNSHFLDSGRKK